MPPEKRTAYSVAHQAEPAVQDRGCRAREEFAEAQVWEHQIRAPSLQPIFKSEVSVKSILLEWEGLEYTNLEFVVVDHVVLIEVEEVKLQHHETVSEFLAILSYAGSTKHRVHLRLH